MDLSGLSFAVKDLFDIEGCVTGFGHPRWAQTHDPARSTAEPVLRLEAAGAVCVGKAICDEMAYSLDGENPTYGTPVNPRAPDRVPGGSSSGSASLTACRLVDFALGTDTGGSVRIPASYCGIFGIRPTHGRISLEGCLPLAPSFDTVGWFTRSADLLQQVADVLLDGPSWELPFPKRVLLVRDAFELADPEITATLERRIPELEEIAPVEEILVAPEGLEVWRNAFRVLQGAEVWEQHGDWIRRERPAFGPGVRERVDWIRSIESRERDRARAIRQEIRAGMAELLGDDTILALPTAPSIAPLRAGRGAEHAREAKDIETRRNATLELTSIAGLCGLPQVSIPSGTVRGAPIGLSLSGPAGSDELLLALATTVPPR